MALAESKKASLPGQHGQSDPSLHPSSMRG